MIACQGGSDLNSMQAERADVTEATTEEVEALDEANEKSAGKDDASAPSKGKTWKRSNKIANTATLFVGDSEQLPLKGSQITVQVDGFRARVLMDCFFYSDYDWQMEGTFKMRLPQGATPFYFAFGESVYLDANTQGEGDSLPFLEASTIDFSPEGIADMRSASWSEPKVARVVEKEKAAFAYGQVVRRRVDPALAEWAGADVYNCRVFPLAPKKLHRIVIGYDVTLTSIQDDWLFNFDIPEVNCPLVIDFDVASIKGVKRVITPIQKTITKNGRTAFRVVKNPQAESITVRYHDLNNMLLTTPKEEEAKPYFAAAVSPELTASSGAALAEDAVLALDVSLSSNPDKFNVWLALAKALLNNNRTKIKRFNVLMFNVEAFWWKTAYVENTAENVIAFLDYANTLALEGASDLGLALSEISTKTQGNAANIFLLSDGAVTWGEGDDYELANKMNKEDVLFAFNTGMSGTSVQKLNHLTRASGGALFSVTGEEEVAKVSQAIQSQPWKIEGIELSNASDVLIEGRPEWLYAGQKLRLVGRGNIASNATVKLKVSQGKTKKTVSMRLKYALASDLTKRTYGQVATTILEGFGYVTEQKSIAYAKHFEIPGKTCSLLMLETEEDYKEYNIQKTEDAYVVESSTVTSILDGILKEIQAMLGNAKVTFKHWLHKLSKTDGVEFKIPEALNLLIEKTPKASFSVANKGLECQVHAKNEVAAAVRDSLAKRHLDYDAINQAAGKRLEQYGAADALKLLSSLVEKSPGNSVLTRDVAYAALNWNLDEQAYYLFKRVLASRPYEPQTYQAIAKTLSKLGQHDLALLYYEIAITATWDGRFGEFRKIAALDYLRLLKELQKQSQFVHKDYIEHRYKTLLEELGQNEVDLMITIAWNTDNTDIDLHVIEPTGEECFYSHPKTKIGGLLTQDVTQGYGPEMYILPKARDGHYKVKAKYFSSNRNRASTRTKIYATVYENWGKPDEKVSTKVITLKDNKEMHDIMIVKR